MLTTSQHLPLYYTFSSHCHLVSVQFSHSVVSDSLRPHGLQHARPPCPSPTPGVYSNSCPLSQWCHPAISSSVIPFSSHLQSFPTSCLDYCKSFLTFFPAKVHDLLQSSLNIATYHCSVTQLCPTLCDPMDCSTPGSPVLHHLLELVQTHLHWVGDAIQPSHPVVSFSSCLQSFPASRNIGTRVLLKCKSDHVTHLLKTHNNVPSLLAEVPALALVAPTTYAGHPLTPVFFWLTPFQLQWPECCSLNTLDILDILLPHGFALADLSTIYSHGIFSHGLQAFAQIITFSVNPDFALWNCKPPLTLSIFPLPCFIFLHCTNHHLTYVLFIYRLSLPLGSSKRAKNLVCLVYCILRIQ